MVEPLPLAAATDVLACPDCDLLQRVPVLEPGDKACCGRCGCDLARRPTDPLDRPLALTVAALIMFVVANTAPIMGLSAVGRRASTTILGGAYEMWMAGEHITAAVVAFCVVFAPALYLLFLLAVLIAVRRPPAPYWVGEMLRWGLHMQPWSMYEVMLLGVLVALIKIAELATVDVGVGMYALGALVVLFPAIMLSFDPREVWHRVEWVEDTVAEPPGRRPSRADA
jgi:paraquat-inducible protein A